MTATPINMDAIRRDVVKRIISKLAHIAHIDGFTGDAVPDTDPLKTPGRRMLRDDINALMAHADLVRDTIKNDIWADIEQLAFLLARDVIEPMLRTPLGQTRDRMEPIQWLTGNAFMPAWRSFEECESIWQADDMGDYFAHLVETLESKCELLEIFIGYPEDDNSIYAVDTRYWERSEAAEKGDCDSLSDEWSTIDPS